MSEHFTFNTDKVDALIDELDAALHRVTTTPVESDELGHKARHNDPNKAQVSRDLLRAADLASHLEAEVRALYWQFKGYIDPTLPLPEPSNHKEAAHGTAD